MRNKRDVECAGRETLDGENDADRYAAEDDPKNDGDRSFSLVGLEGRLDLRRLELLEYFVWQSGVTLRLRLAVFSLVVDVRTIWHVA